MRAVPSRWSHVLLPATAFVVLASSILPAQVRLAASDPTARINPITAEGYINPPPAIMKLVDVPKDNYTFNAGSANPGSRKYMLHTFKEGMPPLAVMGKDHYNLAGWQIEYRANRSRTMTTGSFYGLELYEWETGKTVKIELPAGARASNTSWSPDGKTFAYLADFDTATHIYFADPATGKSRPFTTKSLLATNVTNYYWTADGKSIVVVQIPDGRLPEPKMPTVATEPLVRVNENKTLRTRTLPDVLESPYEKNLVEYHSTGQLAILDVAKRTATKVGAPGMIKALNASPDAKYFEVTYIDKPFSYFQALSSAGSTQVLIDQTGKVIRTLRHQEMREGTIDDTTRVVDPNDPNAVVDTTAGGNPLPAAPRAGGAGRGAGGAAGGAAGGRGNRGGGAGGAAAPVPLRDLGRRNEAWNQMGTGKTFLQVSASTSKDSTVLNKLPDRIMAMPNLADTMAVKPIYESPAGNSIQGFRYSDNGRILFVTETGPTQPGEIAIFLDENNARFVVVPGAAGARGGGGGAAAAGGRAGGGGGAGGAGGRGGRGGAGGGGGGGALVSKTGSHGFSVVMISSDGKSVYTQGATGGKPFIDKIEIKTGTKTRLFESTEFETLDVPLDDDFSKAIVSRVADGARQSYTLDLKTKEAKRITHNKDFWPDMQNVLRKNYSTRRVDNGAILTGSIVLPADWKPGNRLPAIMWFYPAEYESADVYNARGGRGGAGGGGGGRGGGGGAGTGAPQVARTFAPREMSYLTQIGYATIVPETPILGQKIGNTPTLPNDNYVSDLQRDLEATVNALVDSGWVDRNRLAIGGHSYGGFSTANALVHTTLFRAGIAGDGNYNRTLTPNGFQNERRTLWEGRDTYLNMSPFLYANQMTGALLLYHSEEDQNVGTDPINSPKLFHALQGLGKDVALYMYPYEDHGPVARETVLDQWARWVAWLDKYVKNAPPPGK